MGFFTRLSNGWEIAMTSMKVLNANKQLIIFPILSGISLLLVIGSFVVPFLAIHGWDVKAVDINGNRAVMYLWTFVFYIVNYFIVVFFNMALMHCARLYFEGEEVTVNKGLRFSVSRVGAIFAWAVFAATIGTLLKMIQDNLGWLGKILISLVGFLWSIATFFVIPIIAYENVGPYDALQKSAGMMKEKWGETIGANFSIGLVNMVAVVPLAIVAFAVGAMSNIIIGGGVFVLGMVLIFAISSALHSIFISAVYNNINGNLNDHFNQQMLDGLFVQK